MWVDYFILLAVTTFATFSTVNGEGATCSQNGLGPSDMMMSTGHMNPKYMWHKDGRSVKIPVVLDYAYTSKERGVIFGGLAEMASKTCIKFFIHKHPSEIHDDGFVHITKSRGKGCWSFVGKQGGKQDLSLPKGCINHRTVMHEMMHALGFSHEHVRSDRDKFVHILWENIQRGRERNFQRKQDSKSDAFGPYDYNSIMHYERNAFSSNGHDTIVPHRGHVRIGRNSHMSHWDAYKINKAYKCHGGGDGGGHHGVFGNIGFGPEEESPFNGPPVSFHRNPFLPSHEENRHPNEIEQDDHDVHDDGHHHHHPHHDDHGEPDYAPFPPAFPPAFGRNDDYYHP